MAHEAYSSIEEKVAALFQPDSLLSEQYLSGYKSRQLDPGKRLMLAVLEDAVLCFKDNVSAQDARKKALFRDAEAWIMEESTEWIFSFDSVCEALGMDPRYVRGGLLSWKEKMAAGGRRCSGRKRKAA